ncbi:MAG: HmuY family protein [Rikenellaceae bacterium]
MKKVFLTLSVLFIALTSCSDNDNSTPSSGANETYIDATSNTTWHYYSLTNNKVVGTGEETVADNALWFARSDWDFAINRFFVRTNSGEATTVKADGGVYTCAPSISFASVMSLPENVIFIKDKTMTLDIMNGKKFTSIMSTAAVVKFKTAEDGTLVMPPVYMQTPVYIFRTADGKQSYKVQFTQYQNENKQTGHVKFNSALIKK